MWGTDRRAPGLAAAAVASLCVAALCVAELLRPGPGPSADARPAPPAALSARDWAARLAEAYARPVPFEAVMTTPSEIIDRDPAQTARLVADLRATPGVRSETDPLTGKTGWILTSTTVLSDGADNDVLAIRDLTKVGYPELATRVEIWNGWNWIRARLPTEPADKTECGPPLPYEEQLRLRRLGRDTFESFRAGLSPVHRARYLARLLGAAEDTAIKSDDDTRVTIASAVWGCAATILKRTGELEASEVTCARGRTELRRVESWHPEPVFPARFPATERALHRASPAHAPDWERDSALLTYGPVAPIPPPPPARFEWSTYASGIASAGVASVYLPDGTLDESATKRRARSLAPRDSAAGLRIDQTTAARLARTGNTRSRLLLAGGLALVTLGIVLAVRRRMA